jgi:anti-sigma B factor antagonist
MIFSHQVGPGRDGVRVALSGEIDLSVREELRHILTGAVGASPSTIDLDLHEFTFLDCCGIGELIRAYTSALSRGHPLTVSRPRGIVRRVLDLTDVLPVLTHDHTHVVPAGQTAPLDVPRSA